MKHFRPTYFGLLLLLGAITCGGLDHFQVKKSSTTTVASGSVVEQLVGSLGFGDLATFNIADAQEFKNQGVDKNDIDSVKLNQLTLTITSPSGADFTFLDELSFYVEGGSLPKKRIAHGGPFQAGLSTVGLDVDDVELKDYAILPSMSITTEVVGRRPAQDTTVEARIVLDVDVNVSGVLCGG